MNEALPPLLLRGDCMVELQRIPDASVDAIVTDPPYGIDFMGKDWDKSVKLAAGMLGQIAAGEARSDRGPLARGGTHSQGYANHDGLAFEIWVTRWATECLRILKPGGHMLAFGGSRTWHRLAAGIEDAGFEIRDSIAWLYGTGFPKSMDVSKAIDKAAGAQRERVPNPKAAQQTASIKTDAYGDYQAVTHITPTPATDAAREWEGWGTALKPAFEPIVVARKPLTGTVAANVLAHGTGALNIDAARIGMSDEDREYIETRIGGFNSTQSIGGSGILRGGETMDRTASYDASKGRWPANVVLDEDQAAALDAQSGTSKSRVGKPRGAASGEGWGMTATGAEYNDLGGASRFFYVAKAPKSERPVVDGTAHPTVKPLALMRWLIRLVTPPGGCVVDPFAGSGTTLEAAYLEGFESIGCEMTPDYWPLIEARIERVTEHRGQHLQGCVSCYRATESR